MRTLGETQYRIKSAESVPRPVHFEATSDRKDGPAFAMTD